MTPPTKQQSRLIEAAATIQEAPADEADALAFYARLLVQAALPHSNPGAVPAWTRTNGNFTMSVQPGITVANGEAKSIGLPYGSIPRLLMAWITTEAVRTQERTLLLGNSLSGFMREVGIGEATGGRHGSITRLRDQMRRLFKAHISYEYHGENGEVGENLVIARKYNLWWDDKQPAQPVLFDSHITLDADFFQEIIKRPVPVDLRALKALKQSPMGLDLYTWLTYRMSYLEKKTAVSWENLQKQIGADYGDPKNFARKAREHLKEVKALYPSLHIEEAKGRLILHPSPTHVRKELKGE